MVSVRGAQSRLSAAMLGWQTRPRSPRDDMTRIGSAYGGWWVPADLLGAESICYSGGLGTDVTFDTGLIERFSCQVWGIDPTPRSIAWVRDQSLDPRFTLVPLGLAEEPGELRFYAPQNPDHVSHSVVNLQQTDSYFTAEVESLRGVMDRHGHDRVDLVKLDVEGAEHGVIRGMVRDGVLPDVLCVEYDFPEPLRWARETTAALRRAGYGVAHVEGFNVTFVHDRRTAREG